MEPTSDCRKSPAFAGLFRQSDVFGKAENSPPARQSRAIRTKVRGAAAPLTTPDKVYRQSETGAKSAPVKNSSRRIQHIFNENPIPSRRVIHQNVRHRPHQLAVLNNGTAAHTLYDSSCFFWSFFFCYTDSHTFLMIGHQITTFIHRQVILCSFAGAMMIPS